MSDYYNQLQLKNFGDASALTVQRVQRQKITKGQVRVRLEAAPINPADINYMQGNYGIKPDLPTTVGIEGVGRVIESQDPSVAVNSQVIFLERVGTWQEEVVCSACAVFCLPRECNPLQASMLKVNPLTAWQLLHKFKKLPKGSYILQNAANSAVGQCVIQIAKLLGLYTINLVRRDSLFSPLKELGADHVFLDDASAKEKIIKRLGEKNLPSLALNSVGGDSALRLMNCLAEEGAMVTYGAMSRRSLKVPNSFLIFKRLQLFGLWITKDLASMTSEQKQDIYGQLTDWIAEGLLKQSVEKAYPLAEFTDALNHANQAQRQGKILFQCSSEIDC